MRVLVDSCVSRHAAAELNKAGHDAIAVGDWSDDPGDRRLIELAAEQRRVIITLDKDFGELAIVRRLPHAGIIRLVEIAPSRHASVALNALESYGPELAAGAIVTVEPGRIRIRSPQRRDEPERR